MYLLDTNVISALRKTRPHGAVLAWIGGVADADLYISAVTVGEIEAEIEMTRARDKAKAAGIEAWLDQVAATYNILPMDARAFRVWARLMYRQSDQLLEDAMIAATATVHNLVVVTRNIRDFDLLGAKCLDPFIPPTN